MPKNINNLTPLNWSAFVEEAIWRRKNLGITQKEHAALAGVSIPTMISFEKAEMTLSIGKALDILNVVGLAFYEKKDEIGKISGFAEVCERRWLQLIQDLPQNSPVRHPHGYYSYAYVISENLEKPKSVSIDKLLDYLKTASHKNMTGWPPFWIPTREEIKPYIHNSAIECWHKDSTFFNDAAHSDFWRVEPGGFPNSRAYLYLNRGYDEDSMENIEPGTVFDLVFPILRSGEIILHASRLANLITENPNNATIKLQACYTGLKGRVLSSMDSLLYEKRVCKQDVIDLDIEFKVSDINENNGQKDKLANIVHKLLTELYSRFDFFKLSHELVESKLDRMRQNKL